jgi:DNA-binding response OmpR family regulator
VLDAAFLRPEVVGHRHGLVPTERPAQLDRLGGGHGHEAVVHPMGGDQLGAGAAGEALDGTEAALEGAGADGEPHVEVRAGVDDEVEGPHRDVIESLPGSAGAEGGEVIGHGELHHAGHGEVIGTGGDDMKELPNEGPRSGITPVTQRGRAGKSGGKRHAACADRAPLTSLMGTRILTVEDDERIRTAVKMALEDEGWVVEEADTGEEALQAFTRNPADVVLIDIMLPGIDGFDVCRSIRRASDVPIVMVTARADTHDVVAGLEAGADDYLTKPFAPKELSARIRALLRRARTADPSVTHLRFGDLEIVPDEGVVLRDGTEVHLTKTEFRLLVELASSPGRVFSREVLLERVWGYGYFGDGRLVDVHVRRLRMKVEADPANPRHVITVRGLGYKLQQ